jgi:serralysin
MRRYGLAAGAVLCAALWSVPARAFILDSTTTVTWQNTASGTRTANGQPATITWSLVPDGTSTVTEVGNSTTASNLVSFMNANFGGNPSQTDLTKQPWFHIFTDAFGRWNQLGGVNFVYEPHDDGVLHPSSNGILGVRGDIRLAGFNIDGPSGTLAFTYVPSGGSDMAIDTSESALFTSGASLNHVYFRDTLMHEIGHSFGLEHVSTNESATGKLLMEPFIDDSANPIDGPQLDEVRGVQFFFGDVNEKSNGGLGNGTAARATSLGGLISGSTKLVGASADVLTQTVSPTATDFVSISNASDVDFYSFTVSAASTLSALLTPRGGVFAQGSADQNQPATTFDANSRSNLALAILAANGTTVLAAASANPAGIAESIAKLVLPSAGTYYAEVTGADDTIQLYELGLTATQLATILPGDYNHDGVVDAADYAVWRDTLGQSVSAGSGADGNGDGLVTQADYSVWRGHFGQAAAGGASLASNHVPEQPSILLALAGLLADVVVRRRS